VANKLLQKSSEVEAVVSSTSKTGRMSCTRPQSYEPHAKVVSRPVHLRLGGAISS